MICRIGLSHVECLSEEQTSLTQSTAHRLSNSFCISRYVFQPKVFAVGHGSACSIESRPSLVRGSAKKIELL
jgi:hypothetical protein